MQQLPINPFHELYVTETARPEEFVQLFSNLLLPHSSLLFQQGNVVLKGTQGSGKSMLLNLMMPEIRCAYHKFGIDFPVPNKFSRFISAGINITRSGILDIGQRPLTKHRDEDDRLFPLLFSDFLNYCVLKDVLKSLKTMQEHPDIFSFVNAKHNDEFAAMLSEKECWFGYLSGSRTFENLRKTIDRRIADYHAFHAANVPTLPANILNTKTTIGEPLSQTVECLWRSGAVESNTPLFVRIDQHEVLLGSDDLRPGIGVQYRRVINKALGSRDPRLSYRIGTRRHAWDEELTIYGTNLPLEILRDYRIIDIDEILRRHENPGIRLFSKFAEDIFRRRLQHAGFSLPPGQSSLRSVMGPGVPPEALARQYVGNAPAERALKIEPQWPEEWKSLLVTLYQSDPLSAKMAEGWMRQKRSASYSEGDLRDPGNYPWNRLYWRKERIRQALCQLAARSAQRLKWSGAETITSLCMGGTLAFVSVCQHIWDAFLRSQIGLSPEKLANPVTSKISEQLQSLGIDSASDLWYRKISERPGGNNRQRFVDYIGTLFYSGLIDDRAMSYPGHNGFSLLNEEFRQDKEVARALKDAVDYGDLFEAPHTTKYRGAKKRTKWYLAPILSPHFRLPESHVKEPMYVTVSTVRRWLADSEVLQGTAPVSGKAGNVPVQLPLLPLDGGHR